MFFALLIQAFFSVSPSLAYSASLPRHRLDIAFDLAAHRLTGKSIITIPASQADTATVIALAGLEITSLQLDGTPIPATTQHLLIPSTQEEQQLVISFRKIYAQGQADGLIGPSGIALTTLWHPQLDTACRYELTAAIPKHFTAISEAEEISETIAGEIRTVRFQFNYPLETINFVAGPYVVEQESFGSGQNLYSYFFEEDRELAAEYRKKTLAYLKRYQELIGSYPYKRFSIVENRLPTGYAMPTFTLLGQAVVRLPFITETSLGHEVLHSWFGNAVEVDMAKGNWCEGLTTYLADQTFAAEAGNGVAYRKGQLVNYQSYAGPDNTLKLTDFIGADSHFSPGGKAARAVGYDRAGMVFHMLRKKIGDPAFYAGLRIFYARFRQQKASWQDLAATFAESSGRNLDDFFSQWLTRADLPNLSLTLDSIKEKEKRTELSLTIKQLQKKPYQLTVLLEIHTAKGKERREVRLSEAVAKLTIDLNDYPSLVVADPEYDLMRALAPEELPPAWSRFLGAAKRVAIIPEAEEQQHIFAPLIKLLATMNCPIKTADTATDKDLSGKSVIFLGTNSRLARSIFASPASPATGFNLEVRDNPLAPGQVAVMIDSTGAQETAAATPKLLHYGRYGTLDFSHGRIVRKLSADTDQGLLLTVDSPPMGIALPQALPFAAIMERLADKRVIYVGEVHTRYEDHLLQLRVLRNLLPQNPNLAIGMEMFSREAQPVLDRYVAGELSEREFLQQTKYFSNWGYDYRLYREIINFARRNRLPILALNQKKELVTKESKQGVAALTAEELDKIPADRDLSLPGYRRRITKAFAMHDNRLDPEQLNSFFQAQALWDETMAESIVAFLKANPESRMVVLAGQGHTDKTTAIPPRVARRLPGISQVVILNSENEELDQTEGDYLVFSRPAELPPAALLGVMLTDTAKGPMVTEFPKQSKAYAAGIQEKDIILALDDEPVANIDDLKILLLSKETGKTVAVRIKRESGFLFRQESILSISVGL